MCSSNSLGYLAALILTSTLTAGISLNADDHLDLDLQFREETAEGSGRHHLRWKKASWDPEKTAIIICDMWDSHHSVTAVRRVNELAPHLNSVVKALRDRGATVIHAPSDCMDSYRDHAARKDALAVPAAGSYPDDIAAWCHKIPGEEKARYPIDQSDGGEDESHWENAQWAARLEAEGRKPGTPWIRQHPGITIEDGDYISSEGKVVWNILQQNGIEHVALAGVHTNMCVLGRPFGLRRMVAAKMDTVLLRDCTDLMYNPARWPYVSHFTGLDLILEYIEANICPTISSNQITGGEAFRFAGDRRPHLAILVGEKEYRSAESLPPFAQRFLGNDFRITFAFAEEENRHAMPGIRALESADLLLVSVRRRGLPEPDLEVIRRFIASGKPVLGIRTASHAFAPKEEIPVGHARWESFDPDVFGGNYDGHHGGKKDGSTAFYGWVAKEADNHPIVSGLPDKEWETSSWLYKTSPLSPGAQVLAMGRVEGIDKPEPLAWTFTRNDGGRSFYTSLGHPDDFADPAFQRLLVNAIYWAADMRAPETIAIDPNERRWSESWTPATWDELDQKHFREDLGDQSLWIRTLIRTPSELPKAEGKIGIDGGGTMEVYLNGKKLSMEDKGIWKLSGLQAGALNLLVIRIPDKIGGPVSPPTLFVGGNRATLFRSAQIRVAPMSKDICEFPIPPQFGAPADLVQDWPFKFE